MQPVLQESFACSWPAAPRGRAASSCAPVTGLPQWQRFSFKRCSASRAPNARTSRWNLRRTETMCGTRTFSILSLCLMLLCTLPGVLSSANAQQQEKRIALVVGDGAYAKAPLATAANDAGLIAQTLQAAGFDVVGARDLDGDTLRRSFRDFVQKAQTSGEGTIAMVYLAGYG